MICQTFFSSFLKIFEIFFRKCRKHRKNTIKKAFKPLDYNLSEEKSQPYRLKAYDKTLHRCGGQIFTQLQQLCCPFQETNFNFLIVFVLKPVFLIIFHKFGSLLQRCKPYTLSLSVPERRVRTIIIAVEPISHFLF